MIDGGQQKFKFYRLRNELIFRKIPKFLIV